MSDSSKAERRKLGDCPLNEIGFSRDLLQQLTSAGIDTKDTYGHYVRNTSVAAYRKMGDEKALKVMRQMDRELRSLGVLTADDSPRITSIAMQGELLHIESGTKCKVASITSLTGSRLGPPPEITVELVVDQEKPAAYLELLSPAISTFRLITSAAGPAIEFMAMGSVTEEADSPAASGTVELQLVLTSEPTVMAADAAPGKETDQ